MADDYTPSLNKIRDDYVWANTRNHDEFMTGIPHSALRDEFGAKFDRTVDDLVAEKRAEWEAEQGEPEWEYGVYDPASNEVDSCGTDPVTRESFTGIRWEETGEYIVKRRVAGPWEPVTNTESEGKA